MQQSLQFGDLTMQLPYCDHPEYNLFGLNRETQRYSCRVHRRTFQTLHRGNDPALKEQAQKLYFEELELRANS